ECCPRAIFPGNVKVSRHTTAASLRAAAASRSPRLCRISAQGFGPFWRHHVTFWRRWIKRLPGSDASRLARRATKRAAKQALTKGGRDDIIRHTLEAAEIAESEGDADRLRKFSYALLRLGQYGQAWELGARAIDLRQQSPIPEWEGDDLADRSILVRAYAPRNSIGEELRLSRF